MNRLFLPILFCMFSLLICCGTTKETQLGPDYTSIAIPVFQNETMEQGLEEGITASVIRAFIRDRRLRVTDRSHADVVLEARIVRVDITALGFTDLDRAVGYDMHMLVRAKLVGGEDGEIIQPERAFQARGPFLLANTITMERQQDIGDRLADNIISAFLDGW